MLNTIKTKHYTCYMKDNKLVSAKCNTTKRFVKRSIAQVELNNVKRKQAIRASLSGLNMLVVVIVLFFTGLIYAISKKNAYELFTLFDMTAITVFSVETMLVFLVVYKFVRLAYSETMRSLNTWSA